MKLEEVQLVKSTADEQAISKFAKASCKFCLIGMWDAFSIALVATAIGSNGEER